MRSFALLSLSMVLAFAGCTEKEPSTSATETTTTTGPQTTTTETTTTSTTTTGETMTTTTGSTTEAVPTTGPSMTTTTTTTGMTTETTTTTTTGETETASTTDMVIPSMGPYESCSNDQGVGCTGDAVCVDSASTKNMVKGSFCAPKCSDMEPCPVPDGLDPDVQAFCAFDTNNDGTADICALLCIVANDDCPEGSMCEDIGIAEMGMPPIKFGVCTFPA